MDLTTRFPALHGGNGLLFGAWLLVSVLAAVAYLPALHGPFVLDDAFTLAALGENGGIVDWRTFSEFVFGGITGPTGRPLALATFVLDGTTWPTDAYSFKRTNLILHIVNAALLCFLTQQILRILRFDRTAAGWIAIVSAGLWLLHPFLVSTTMYVVQRMAQLSTMFVFAGLITYLYGRAQVATAPRRGYVIMSVGLIGFTVLAVLSKESGILLPLLAGVLEFAVVSSEQSRMRQLHRNWRVVFFWAPAVVILGYMTNLTLTAGFFETLPHRNFSPWERLLTEGRVLLDYARHWFLPDTVTAGVFQDHFLKSNSLLSPVMTLVAILVHALLIVFAIRKRNQWPLFALAVLFFYTAHLLESTFLNLELYFEHRNYLANAFLFLPIVVLVRERIGLRGLTVAALLGMLILGSFTRISATAWSSYPTMVEAAAQKAPTSVRAQTRYATNLFNEGQYEQAITVLDNAIAANPEPHADLIVNRLYMLCRLGVLDQAEFARASEPMASLFFNPGLFRLHLTFAGTVSAGACPEMSLAATRPLYERMLSLPENSNPDALPASQLNFLIGLAALDAAATDDALAAFDRSLGESPDPVMGMRIARVLESSGNSAAAADFAGRLLRALDSGAVEPVVGIDSEQVRAFIASLDAPQSGDTERQVP